MNSEQRQQAAALTDAEYEAIQARSDAFTPTVIMTVCDMKLFLKEMQKHRKALLADNKRLRGENERLKQREVDAVYWEKEWLKLDEQMVKLCTEQRKAEATIKAVSELPDKWRGDDYWDFNKLFPERVCANGLQEILDRE